jgi:hypothetical protein
MLVLPAYENTVLVWIQFMPVFYFGALENEFLCPSIQSSILVSQKVNSYPKLQASILLSR